MNKQIAIAGALGVLGQEILPLLAKEGYYIRSIIRRKDKHNQVSSFSNDVWITDARRPEKLVGCFDGIDIVISTVGKSISIFTPEPDTFFEIDYQANCNLLREAQQSDRTHAPISAPRGGRYPPHPADCGCGPAHPSTPPPPPISRAASE
ncbi:MAG: NAD(P)H-binding protein, partial [Bacteroidota bacterium]